MSAKKKAAPAHCRTKGCTNEARARGLCPRCLAYAYSGIKGGAVTDEQLVKRGILLPRRTAGRIGKDNPVKQAIQRINR